MSLFSKLRRVIAPSPIPIVPPIPSEAVLHQGRLDAFGLLDRVPGTYLLAKQRYAFLPERSVELDVFWADASIVSRVTFLLDYVARLYQRIPLDAVAVSPRPLIAFRTTDHPAATVRQPQSQDLRAYAVFFDTDDGSRVELHMGHLSYLGLAACLCQSSREMERWS